MLSKKSILIAAISVLLCFTSVSQKVSAADSLVFIMLSCYSTELSIGDSFYLAAVASNGKRVTFKSSDSKIASVNTYGKVTAKKGGTAAITAKTSKAEVSCRVKVNPTVLTMEPRSASIEHNGIVQLTAAASNGSSIKWKSNKKSIATVDEFGKVTGGKPGEAIITASADGTDITCKVTVRKPLVKISHSAVSLNRTQTVQLTAEVSSGLTPAWKTNKKSVAIVNENGLVTAVKNGTAVITATVDGVAKTCEITVQKPDITLDRNQLTIKAGSTASLKAEVSSGNKPVWSSSNTNIASVNADGTVTAIQKGTAYIYAAEDGTKVRCSVKVIEP